MFGLTFEKLLIIGVIAAFIIGPERLPRYAAKLGEFARGVRDFATGAKDRVREEMGEDFDEVDWRKLDPRQYDPRRIIREALTEDPDAEVKPVNASAMTAGAAAGIVATPGEEGASAVAATRESAFAQRQRKLKEAAAAAQGAGRNAVTPFDVEAT